MLSYHSALHKSLPWYKKGGIHFFEMLVLNAFYLYKRSEVLSSEKIDIKSFIFEIATTWKVSKYGVFSGPYFHAFELNTERHSVSPRIQSKCEKIRTRNNSVFGHFSCSVQQHLLGHKLSDPEHQALADFHDLSKLPRTEKKTNPTKPCVYVQKTKSERNLDISAKNVKIILHYV